MRNDGIENYAILMGNTPMYPQYQDYLGFDGTPMDVEFTDLEDYSSFLRRKKSRKSRGGFGNFLDSIGLSREAAERRRSLRDRKQRMAEQQMLDTRKSEQENMRLQQQAIQAAANVPSGQQELSQILASQQVTPTGDAGITSGIGLGLSADQSKTGWWKGLKTWQKGAIIGGGVLVVAVGAYLIIKSKKNG